MSSFNRHPQIIIVLLQYSEIIVLLQYSEIRRLEQAIFNLSFLLMSKIETTRLPCSHAVLYRAQQRPSLHPQYYLISRAII